MTDCLIKEQLLGIAQHLWRSMRAITHTLTSPFAEIHICAINRSPSQLVIEALRGGPRLNNNELFVQVVGRVKVIDQLPSNPLSVSIGSYI
jgi:hypothetical protein